MVSGTFADEFLRLPAEVLTTTMIHHQHFFPLASAQGQLMPAFLAVLNMEPEKPEAVARNLERVLTARLRDARFFWDADRGQPLERHRERLSTVAFHKGLGTFLDKAERLEPLARWIAVEVLGRPDAADAAARAARLCKADPATSMVRELTELQGTIGGLYAREDGEPEAVWKAIYHHYLPTTVEPDGAPTRAELGAAAVPWAAVALADKLDTVAGLFAAGERPTGSRDPYGIRRAAQGIVRILTDLPELTGLDVAIDLRPLVERARAGYPAASGTEGELALWAFLQDRVRSVFEQRGADVRNVRAVTHNADAMARPLVARRKLAVLPELAGSADFAQLAGLFKRVRNIAVNLDDATFAGLETSGTPLTALTEPAELALGRELAQRRPVIESSLASGDGYRRAFAEAAAFGPAVAKFFDDVMVMTDDPAVREARLRLMRQLESLILQLADVAEMVPQSDS